MHQDLTVGLMQITLGTTLAEVDLGFSSLNSQIQQWIKFEKQIEALKAWRDKLGHKMLLSLLTVA